MRWLRSFALIPVALAAEASAHGVEDSSRTLAVEPVAGGLLALSIGLYALGRARMSPAQRRAIAPSWRVACFAAAVVTIGAALFSPLDTLSEGSFAWHMFQHLLLMLVSAPLLSLANAHLVSIFVLPLGPRRSVAGSVSGAPGMKSAATARSSPFVVAVLFAAGLWLWHAPRMFQSALDNPVLHTLEHLTFLVTSAVFWRMVLRAGDRRLDPASAILLTVIVGLQANLLAALILLSPQVLYPAYAGSGLEDQQLAALLMFVPASLVFLAATIGSLIKLVGGRPRGRPRASTEAAR